MENEARRTGLPAIRASRATGRRDGLFLVTNVGQFLIPWSECSPTLAAAKQYQRIHVRLLPAGIGVHWPLLDEDLAIGPLVEGREAIGRDTTTAKAF